MELIKSLKHIPKVWIALSYLVLLLLSLTLFFGRTIESIRVTVLLHTLSDFYDHVSNFSLSFAIFITIGYVGLMTGLTLRHIISIGALIIVLNLIIECLISFLNTRDIMDAIYGISGVILGFFFLFITKKYGLKKNEL